MSHKDYQFEPIKGIQASLDADPRFLVFTGLENKIKQVKKLLSLHNKSAEYQVLNARQTLVYWGRFESVLENADSEKQEKIKDKIKKAKETIEKFSDLIDVEYYESINSCSVRVPKGYWWLAENGSSFVENTEIKPVYLSGMRDYQKEALNLILRYTNDIVMLATGLGKSYIIASLCVSAVKVGKRVMIVVPTVYLVNQIYKTVKEHVSNTKAYGGQFKALPLGADVLVVTAHSANKFVSDYHVIAVDETHHTPASTWVNLLYNAEKATHIYGLTATPYRSDGMDMAIHSFMGPVIYKKTARWGIENGWLKSLAVYLVTVNPTSNGKKIFLPRDYNGAKAYAALVVNSPECYKTLLSIVKKALDSGRKILVLFKTVKAGVMFKKYCKNVIEFNVASEKNKKPIQDFVDGKVSILVSNDRLLSEGVDIPSIDTLVLVTQNNSNVITSQAVGRILRPVAGFDKDAVVFDVTVTGYDRFVHGQRARAKVYSEITDKVKVLT